MAAFVRTCHVSSPNYFLTFDIDMCYFGNMTCCENPVKPFRKGLCNRCYQRRWAQTHYLPHAGYSAWAQAHPERVMWLGAKHHARRLGVPFTIKLEDITIPEYCPVLGIKLSIKGGDDRETAPSLDRKIGALGYILGNVFVISNRANRIKSDATADELEKIARYIKLDS